MASPSMIRLEILYTGRSIVWIDRDFFCKCHYSLDLIIQYTTYLTAYSWASYTVWDEIKEGKGGIQSCERDLSHHRWFWRWRECAMSKGQWVASGSWELSYMAAKIEVGISIWQSQGTTLCQQLEWARKVNFLKVSRQKNSPTFILSGETNVELQI